MVIDHETAFAHDEDHHREQKELQQKKYSLFQFSILNSQLPSTASPMSVALVLPVILTRTVSPI